MKQILAIIRDDQVGQTTTALAKIGIRGISFLYVTGRSGREKGTDSAREQRGVLNGTAECTEGQRKFSPTSSIR